MKCRGRVVEKRDAPLPLMLDRDERLNRVDGWVDVRLPGRHHTNDRAEEYYIRRKQAYLSNDPYIRCCLMMSEDLAKLSRNFLPSVHLTPIEPDDIAVFGN